MSLPAVLSPVGCLTLLWSELPATLVGEADRASIETEVTSWPHVPRVAFELRLGGGNQWIDLHQYLTRAPEEMAALSGFLARRRSSGLTGEADVLLNAWLGDTNRCEKDCIFLEWDRTAIGYTAQPALFIQVDPLRDTSPVAERLEKIWSVARGPVSIRFVGRMWRSAAPQLRVNLRGIRRGELPAVLDEIGWPGLRADVGRNFDALVDVSDRVVVAIDVGYDVMPGIGFEIFLDEPVRREPRWSLLFDHLEQEGLCRSEQREQLLNACGVSYPTDSQQDWPAAWIVAALRAPPSVVPCFERRISHLKLNIDADGHRTAKAYFAAQHLWQRLAPPGPARIEVKGERSDQESRLAAIRFLLCHRHQNGLWGDFRSGRGVSDEWLSAVVAWALAGTREADILIQLDSTVSALRRRQRANGGWGFSSTIAPDADSTAWVLRFFSTLGIRDRAFERGLEFLREYLLPDGGIATYIVGQDIPATEEERRGGVGGWHVAHACVAANAAEFLGDSAKAWLVDNQNADGSWTAHWWRNDMLATALATETLVKLDPTAGRRARAWALCQKAEGLPACDRAWLVRLLRDGDQEQRSRGRSLLEGLRAEQRLEGSWPASAILLVTNPANRTRSADDFAFTDGSGLFTTACVLAAMRGEGNGGAA